ncbi:MAG: hypothetical protein JXA21_01080 [Anaerolineae bacterium]|nr:hypothetical protein [Anaerolineae bacterium]
MMKKQIFKHSLILWLLLCLLGAPLGSILAHEMRNAALILSETDVHALGGTSVAGELSLEHGDRTATVTLTQADYQAIFNAADAKLGVGMTFRNSEMLIVPSATITQAMQNYSNFQDGEYFKRYCADYDAISALDYCPAGDPADWPGKSLDIRNQLRDALKGYAVLLTSPAHLTITVAGQPMAIQDAGRQGMLATLRELAYDHLIFGNEFLIDATDTRYGAAQIPDAETVIYQELAELEQALQQFNLAMDVASYAFSTPLAGAIREGGIGEDHGGDYFTALEFEVFGVASSRTVATLLAMAERRLKLGQESQALDLYNQAYMVQYFHAQALAQMARQTGADYLINGSWEIYNNMAETRNAAQKVVSGVDVFGFPSDYAPLQSYAELREMVVGPAGNTGLLGVARDLEIQSRTAQRDYDEDQDAVAAELDSLIAEYDDALFELCGEDPERPGSGEPSLTTCEGGLVEQNWSDIFAADKRAGLAVRRAANIIEQIKIEQERAGKVIQVTFSTGEKMAAYELSIGALEAVKFTGSSVASSETQLQAGIETGVKIYERAEIGVDTEVTNWTTGGVKFTALAGIEHSTEAKLGFLQTLAWTSQMGVEFDNSALPIAEINGAKALREAEAAATIEGANSAATVKNLLLQQSELLIETEIAVEELNKLMAEHNQLSTRRTRLLNRRGVAVSGAIQANAQRNGPAYRVMADALTVQADEAFALAAQFAYLAAKAVEYEMVSPYPAIGDIFTARSANDVYAFMNALHVYYQAPVIENNPYPYTLSIAKDLLGLTDQNIDPTGLLTPGERAEIRYAGFQQFLWEQVDVDGNLEFRFTTSLDLRRSATQYMFSPNIWGNRIAGVGSPLPASQGVGVNIRTRQVTDVGVPEVRLTHGGQASYRNPTGAVVHFDPGPAMPVGYTLPDGLNPVNISVVMRPGVNGANVTRYDGLKNLSVAASEWTLRIPYNSKGELNYALMEDIEVLVDSTGRAIQGRQLQAQRDSQRLQAGLDLEPVIEEVSPVAAVRTAAQLLPAPSALRAMDAISDTYHGSVLITAPMEIGVQVLDITLVESDGVLTGAVDSEASPLYSTPAALRGRKDGDAFVLASDVITSVIGGRSVQQSFRLEGAFSHHDHVIEATYTGVITNYIATPIVVAGQFGGRRLVGGNALNVQATPWSVPVGHTAAVTTTLFFSNYPVSETTYFTLTSDLGTFSPSVVALVDGVAATTFTAGAAAGNGVITAANGLITGSTMIEVVALDTPVKLVVEATPAVIFVNESAFITVTLRNVLDQVVSVSDRITLTSNLGAVTPLSGNAVNGVMAATFTAGSVPGVVSITATNGALVGLAHIEIHGAAEKYIYLPLVQRSTATP